MKKSLKNRTEEKKLFMLHGVGVIFACVFAMFSHDTVRAFPNFLTRMLLPSNYSLWEQGKILLTGMSIWFIIEYFIVGRKLKGFVYIHSMIAACLPIAMLLIYTSHTLVFSNFESEYMHIIVSVALILAAFVISTIMTLSDNDYSIFAPYGIAFFVVIVIIYAILTFIPPNVGIFFDEVSNVYGPAW